MKVRTPIRLAAAGSLLISCLAQASAAPHRTQSQPTLAARNSGARMARAMGGGIAARQFGFGGGNTDTPLVVQFDRDKDGRLDATERQAAREYAESMGLARQ